MNYASIVSDVINYTTLILFIFIVPTFTIYFAFRFDTFRKWLSNFFINLFSALHFDRENNYHFSKNIILSKGRMGEMLVNILTVLNLDEEKYHLFKHVSLPTAEGTTQIDHILLSPFGIFVIETKNMKGWIFGSINQKVWTQKVFNFTRRFQNPEHQNYKHKKVLQELLNLRDEQVHSVIVFAGDCEIKTSVPENILKAKDYVNYVKSKKKAYFTNRRLLEMGELIEKKRLAKTEEVDLAHANHINEIKQKKAASKKLKQATNIKEQVVDQKVDSTQEDKLLPPLVVETVEKTVQKRSEDQRPPSQSDSIIQESLQTSVDCKSDLEANTTIEDTNKQSNRSHQADQDFSNPQEVEEKICSRCGCSMVIREAKKGKNAGSRFWGCSSYPKCWNVELLTDQQECIADP